MMLEGDGDLHGFWIQNERSRLRPEVAEFVALALTVLSAPCESKV
ncbi:MAG: hypothetical protein ACAI35_13190 [Candidatus Methylacidiphilales bacterium]|nr:hypothetical protein [Candidatus Methylacidiphilales bacterium]